MAYSRSLVPRLFARDWWDGWDYPPRLFEQQFGMELRDEDIVPVSSFHGPYLRPRRQLSRSSTDGTSEVANTKNNFQVKLDVSQFTPSEITVKTVDNSVVVNAKHEEKVDEHGFVSREFTRRYLLPAGTDPEKVISSLSSEGILTIDAPKKAIEAPAPNERIVPLKMSAAPAVEK